jgi:hypothetical protein
LWAAEGRALTGASELRAQIKSLPEAQFDDSHHRDFFVMLGLGVLDHAVGGHDPQAGAAELEELNALLGHLANELDLDGLPAELAEAALRIEMKDGSRAASELRSLSAALAVRVDGALAPVARMYGWPPDRVRRPALG